MRRPRRHVQQKAEIDLTPSLDVVFILLIFFIVTATFIEEQTLSLEPPAPNGPPSTATTIYLHLDADGLVSVNGRLMDISRVEANIQRLRAETPDSNLLIQANPAAKNGALLRVRDAAYSAGFSNKVAIGLSSEDG